MKPITIRFMAVYSMLPSVWLPFILLLLPALSWSQTAHLTEIAMGVSSVALRDQGMSPLMYTGFGVNAELGYRSQKQAKLSWATFNYHQSELKNRHNNPVSFRTFELHAGFLKGNPDTLTKPQWGISNRNQLLFINNPSLVNFNERSYYFTSFGIASSLSRRFSVFSVPLTFKLPVDFQMIGFYIEPSFTSNIPEGFIDREGSTLEAFMQSVRFFDPFRSQAGGMAPELSHTLKSGQQVSLRYHVNLLRIGSTQKFTSIAGNWNIKLSVLL